MTDHSDPPDPATAYHALLLRTSRFAMGSLVLLCIVEAIAYSPWFAERAPFGISDDQSGPALWALFLLWTTAGAWSTVTLVRGRGAGALAVAVLCAGYGAGFWTVWLFSLVGSTPGTRDYLGAALYTTLAALLFTGRTLARGLLVLSAHGAEAGR